MYKNEIKKITKRLKRLLSDADIFIYNEIRTTIVHITRKPCYRKDDRAVRPIAYMGAVKIFESPCIATPI